MARYRLPYEDYSISSRVGYTLRDLPTKKFVAASEALEQANQAAVKFSQGAASGAITLENYGNIALQASKKVLVWQTAVLAVYGVLRKVDEVVESWKELEVTLQRISITTDQTGGALYRYFSQVADIATEFGMPIEKTLVGMDLAMRATASYTDSVERATVATQLLRDASALANITGMDYTNAIDILVGSLRQSGMALSQGTALLDKWVLVAKNAATSVNDLSQGFAIMADAAKSAGLTVDEVNGLIAALSESVTLGPVEVGNAIRAIMSTLYNPGSINLLRKYGVSVRDVDGEVRSFWEVMSELSAMRMQGVLDESSWLEIAKAAGAGQRRYAQFLAILNNWSTAERIAAISAEASGQAMDANNKIVQTYTNTVDKFTASWKRLVFAFGIKSGFLDTLTSVTQKFADTFTWASRLSDEFFVLTRAIMSVVTAAAVLRTLSFVPHWLNIGAGAHIAGTGLMGALAYAPLLGNLVRGATMPGAKAEFGKAGWFTPRTIATGDISHYRTYKGGMTPAGDITLAKSFRVPLWSAAAAPGSVGPLLREENRAWDLNRYINLQRRGPMVKPEAGLQNQVVREAMNRQGRIPAYERIGVYPVYSRQPVEVPLQKQPKLFGMDIKPLTAGGFGGLFRPLQWEYEAKRELTNQLKAGKFEGKLNEYYEAIDQLNANVKNVSVRGRYAAALRSPWAAIGPAAAGIGTYMATKEVWTSVGSTIGTAAGMAWGPLAMAAGGAIGGVIGHGITDQLISEEDRINGLFKKVAEEFGYDLTDAISTEGMTEEQIRKVAAGAAPTMSPWTIAMGDKSFFEKIGAFIQRAVTPQSMAAGAFGGAMGMNAPLFAGLYQPLSWMTGKFGPGKEWESGLTAVSGIQEALKAGIIDEEQMAKILEDNVVRWDLMSSSVQLYVTLLEAAKLADEDYSVQLEERLQTLLTKINKEREDATIQSEYVKLQADIAAKYEEQLASLNNLSPKLYEEMVITELLSEKSQMTTEAFKELNDVISGMGYGFASYLVYFERFAQSFPEIASSLDKLDWAQVMEVSRYNPELWGDVTDTFKSLEDAEKRIREFKNAQESLIEFMSRNKLDYNMSGFDAGNRKALEDLEEFLVKAQPELPEEQQYYADQYINALATQIDDLMKLQNLPLTLAGNLKLASRFKERGDIQLMPSDDFTAIFSAFQKEFASGYYKKIAEDLGELDKSIVTWFNTDTNRYETIEYNTFALKLLKNAVDDNTDSNKQLLDATYNIPSEYAVPNRYWYYRTTHDTEFGAMRPDLYAQWAANNGVTGADAIASQAVVSAVNEGTQATLAAQGQANLHLESIAQSVASTDTKITTLIGAFLGAKAKASVGPQLDTFSETAGAGQYGTNTFAAYTYGGL